MLEQIILGDWNIDCKHLNQESWLSVIEKILWALSTWYELYQSHYNQTITTWRYICIRDILCKYSDVLPWAFRDHVTVYVVLSSVKLVNKKCKTYRNIALKHKKIKLGIILYDISQAVLPDFPKKITR